MTNAVHALTKGIASLAMLALPVATHAATVTTSKFGTTPSGEAVTAIKLVGDDGVSVVLITLGAAIQAFDAPDRNGKVADITIGYDKVSAYLDAPNYWGQTIGRYANRIANGSFRLDGKTFQLIRNDGTNSLHGGKDGFDKRNWNLASVHTNASGSASATMTLLSSDGDQGYPGNLKVRVTYTLDDHGSLTIDYSATTDRPTIVNLTNHALFNLGGNGWPYGTYDEKLTIPASRYTPVNSKLIPTGELRAVAGTVFDFRKGRMLYNGIRDGSDTQIVLAHGWDHNFVLDKGHSDTPQLAARLEHPASGRVLEVLTTAPGLQFYSGSFLAGTLLGKGNVVYRMGDAVALEAQLFPDTPNQPAFGSAELDPGQTYHLTIVYRVSTQK